MNPFLDSAIQENGQLREQSAEVEKVVARAEQHLSALSHALHALHVQIKHLEHDALARQKRLRALLENVEALEQRLLRRLTAGMPRGSTDLQ